MLCAWLVALGLFFFGPFLEHALHAAVAPRLQQASAHIALYGLDLFLELALVLGGAAAFHAETPRSDTMVPALATFA